MINGQVFEAIPDQLLVTPASQAEAGA